MVMPDALLVYSPCTRVSPAWIAVATPDSEIDSTFVSKECQWATAVTSLVEPSTYVAMADNCAVAPGAIDAGPEICTLLTIFAAGAFDVGAVGVDDPQAHERARTEPATVLNTAATGPTFMRSPLRDYDNASSTPSWWSVLA